MEGNPEGASVGRLFGGMRLVSYGQPEYGNHRDGDYLYHDICCTS